MWFAEGNVGSGHPGQETSEGNNINNWARNRACLLAKIVDAFCLCPKSLPEN